MNDTIQIIVGAMKRRAEAAQAAGRYAEAAALYREIVKILPRDAEALAALGTVEMRCRRPDEALKCLDAALALQPGDVRVLNNRGAACRALHRPDEALATLDRALALDPDHVGAHYNRALALIDLMRTQEALEACQHAIALNPDYAEAHCCLGNIFKELGRYDEALAAYDRAIACRPTYAQPVWNRALIALVRGDFARGWTDYEARWRCNIPAAARIRFTEPRWDGKTPLAGKTLLVHAEQGLGDTIQFSRYLPLLPADGEVLFLVPKPLLPLFETLPGRQRLIAKGDPLPAFDLHIPLMSLPLAFATNEGTIPNRVPYLAADPIRRAGWEDKLGPRGRPRIGLAWSGRQGMTADVSRSLTLENLAEILRLPFDFHALQKDIRPRDRAHLADFPDLAVHDADLHDFADTAALIEAMDLVIAVDTSIAHAAGALGKKLWLLLPFVPDWRWRLDRSDSTWYPSAELFRQRSIGDWHGVVTAVHDRLRQET